MKFAIDIMNKLSDALLFHALQKPVDVHSEVNSAFNNAVLKGVGFIKVSSDGKVTNIDPENVTLIIKGD